MKLIRNLLLGLLVVVLATSATTNSKNETSKNAKTPLTAKKKRIDQLAGLFTFTATATGTPGYYAIYVTFNDYDHTAQTLQAGPCPQNINITITSGPYSGAEFTFPSGTTTYFLGDLLFPSNPAGSDYNISTNITTLGNGWPVDQHLVGGALE